MKKTVTKRTLVPGKSRVAFKAKAPDLPVRDLVATLVEDNPKRFQKILGPEELTEAPHHMEAVYSRKEIRQIVEENLISAYQNDEIIEAVTDYLYHKHVEV
ncbi:MAG: hypothetical protein H7A33_04280 [Deltaproteobacteria bacterium]|nr:hypothetical protein [Deltaproteobacteria bacterium]